MMNLCEICNNKAIYIINNKYEIKHIYVCEYHLDDVISKEFRKQTIKLIKII